MCQKDKSTSNIYIRIQTANGERYENGKTRAVIVHDYDLRCSLLDKGVKKHQAKGSFSAKDNRIEVTFKALKTEVSNNIQIDSLEQLVLELDDWVYCYNNIRNHGRISYVMPMGYKLKGS